MGGALRGKVAAVVDTRTLVVNKGSADGMRAGDVLSIVAPVEEVKDPETGEVLGSWELVKARVVADHVQERLTVCSSMPESSAGVAAIDTNCVSLEMVQACSRTAGAREELPVAGMRGRPKANPIAVGDSFVRQEPGSA